jgi:hypothetical protein
MARFSSQTKDKKVPGDKSIPEHIIDGSILIDSVEAFKSILKQYPENAALLKARSYRRLFQKNWNGASSGLKIKKSANF